MYDLIRLVHSEVLEAPSISPSCSPAPHPSPNPVRHRRLQLPPSFLPPLCPSKRRRDHYLQYLRALSVQDTLRRAPTDRSLPSTANFHPRRSRHAFPAPPPAPRDCSLAPSGIPVSSLFSSRQLLGMTFTPLQTPAATLGTLSHEIRSAETSFFCITFPATAARATSAMRSKSRTSRSTFTSSLSSVCVSTLVSPPKKLYSRCAQKMAIPSPLGGVPQIP